jgi:hypothetical protein
MRAFTVDQHLVLTFRLLARPPEPDGQHLAAHRDG